MAREAAADRAPHRVVLRALSVYRERKLTDSAATLTYFAMMSLFPALLVGVTLLGLFGQQSLAPQAADYLLRHGADRNTARVVGNAIDTMVNASSGALGATLFVSLLIALNGASGAFGAAGRALNRIYGVDEERGFVRRKAVDVATAVAVIVLFAVVLVAVFLGGQITHDLFGKIGLGATAATIWSIARWPLAVSGAMVAYALVYALAPDVDERRFHLLSVGAVLGVALWIAASFGFFVYVRNFSTYGAVYGAFGAAIVLLLWLYLSANAFLFGATLNAEIAQSERSVSSGG